jgi:hypothetical protein
MAVAKNNPLSFNINDEVWFMEKQYNGWVPRCGRIIRWVDIWSKVRSVKGRMAQSQMCSIVVTPPVGDNRSVSAECVMSTADLHPTQKSAINARFFKLYQCLARLSSDDCYVALQSAAVLRREIAALKEVLADVEMDS